MTDFVHLHVHSDFSLQDAAVSVTALAEKAEKLGMRHLALTDHGNLFGAMEFLAACERTSVKPIIGCEVYVASGSRFEKKASENENKYYHLVLLAANREGYFNLVKLSSFAYTEGFYSRPRIDEELLAKYRGGLIALSACVSGEIPILIQSGKFDEAFKKACYYRELFGKDEKGNPNFYLEIQEHGIPASAMKNGMSQKEINKEIIKLSRQTGIPLVATNDVHYLEREDFTAHDILLCIGSGKVRSEEKRKKFYADQFYFKTGDEMAALFPEHPEAIANTVRIAERCVTDVPNVTVKELPQYLPDFEIPAGFDNADLYLRHLVDEGLTRRYPKEKTDNGGAWQEIKKRGEYELDVIIQMGFTGYFLIVADFINWAREQNIPVGPGRGSGAGSIVAYALRITDIEPLKYGLLFERFLNPERISMPDFDVDFAKEGRDDVIRYITEKYGRQQVGQIITFGTLGARAVIKDVARVLGISIPDSERITKLVPKDPKITLAKAAAFEPKLREMEQDPAFTELFLLARKLEGLNRHSGIHASGVVIGKFALQDLVPLYKDPKTGVIATQYAMNHLENCGLVKMDCLGLKTLDVIKHAEELVRSRGGEFAGFSVETAPEDDEATFRMLGEGKSYELFQFESDGMQDTLRRAKPGKIEDLIALNALYRPGPMANIPQFIDSKHGRQAIVYPDPSLEDVLKETYGVIVYQEQVMQVARIIAGYNMGQADLLRRAMGKKIKKIIDEEKIPFMEGAVKLGFSAQRAGEVYDILVPFAGYGFNKSHAAGYAVLAYRTAYLKANFPAEFMCACLTNEIHAADKDGLSECIAEARKMGLTIDPPDINRSGKLFTIVDGHIVYGLLGIKGLGEGPADTIVNCRQEGPYIDFMDFLNRIDIKAVGKSVIEKLIQTGAFDNFGHSRETLLGNLERVVEYVQNIKDEKKFGQGSLFGDSGEKEFPDYEFEKFPETSRAQKLKIEKELIGFFFSGHPMDEYKSLWQKLVKTDLSQNETLLAGQRSGGSQILVGLLKNIKTFTTSRGDKMAFASLEDYNGEIELTFFSGVWEKCQDKIEADKVAILRGKIDYQQNKDKYSFTVEEHLETRDLDEIVKQEEIQNRRWDKFRNVLKYAKDLDLRILDLAAAAKAEPGTYTIIGILKSLRTHIDKKGKEMAFGTLQDSRGEIDIVFFARSWENCKALAAVDEMLALKGTVDPAKDKKSEKPGFLVSSIHDTAKLIRAAAKKAAAAEPGTETEAENQPAAAEQAQASVASEMRSSPLEIHIRLIANAADNEAGLYSLRDFLAENPGPCPVFIHIPGNQKETLIRTASRISAGFPESAALEKHSIVADVWSVVI